MLEWDWNHLTSWPVKPLNAIDHGAGGFPPMPPSLACCAPAANVNNAKITVPKRASQRTWIASGDAFSRPLQCRWRASCHENTFWRMVSAKGIITCTGKNGGWGQSLRWLDARSSHHAMNRNVRGPLIILKGTAPEGRLLKYQVWRFATSTGH